MLSSPSRRSQSTIQNFIVIRHFVLLAERAAQIRVEDVVARRGVDGAARVGTNNNINVFGSAFFDQRTIMLLIKAKESKMWRSL